MIPLAVVGGGIKLVQGFVDIGAGLLLAMGTIVGAQVGSAVIKRFKPATLKLIFGLYFLYVAVKFITAFLGIRIWGCPGGEGGQGRLLSLPVSCCAVLISDDLGSDL